MNSIKNCYNIHKAHFCFYYSNTWFTYSSSYCVFVIIVRRVSVKRQEEEGSGNIRMN